MWGEGDIIVGPVGKRRSQRGKNEGCSEEWKREKKGKEGKSRERERS